MTIPLIDYVHYVLVCFDKPSNVLSREEMQCRCANAALMPFSRNWRFIPVCHYCFEMMKNCLVLISIVLLSVCYAGRDFYKILGVDR